MALSKEFGIIQNLSLSRFIAFSAALILVRWILRGFYRVYFHPLSRFPGPKLSAFTRLPHLTATYKGRLPRHVAELHEEYGEVVRISPDELSFLHPNAWRDIYGYGSKEGKGSVPSKDWQRYGKAANDHPSLILMRDDVEHAQSRKIFSPAFSDRALTQQAPLFTKYADQLVRSLKEDEIKGTKVDLVRMYNFATFDVMGDLTFGEPLHMLDNAEYDPWVRIIFSNIKRGVKLGLIYNNYPLVAGILRKLLQRFVSKMLFKHLEHSSTRVTKRLEKGRDSEGIDLWDLVLQQEDKGKKGLSRGEMDSNAGLFMIAGTETTATLLSGATYLLLQHPDSMKKLQDEVRSTFASTDDITMEAIAGLPYVNAVMKESLRVYPPVPIGLPRRTPADGSTICGHYVPPNFTIAAHHLPMYSSPRMFKDPQSFVPERWLGDERFAMDERSVLQPFSIGSRDCLGKNMAYHEMRLLLTKVIYNFDLEFLPESQGWMENQEIYSLWQKTPLMAKVKAVGSA